MKLKYPFLKFNEKPISTVNEYALLKKEYDALRRQERTLRLKIKFYEGTDQEESSKFYQELKCVEPQTDNLKFQLGRRTPSVLISICPYCGVEIWQKIGIFSLLDEFWYKSGSNGKAVLKESQCPHLFCIDGALNLNEHQPTEQNQAITSKGATSISMAAEVPFIKPRVLNLPTMRAVVHSLPVAERYTAYPIVYFAEKQPAEHIHFCIPWASTSFDGMHPYANNRKICFTGKRSDQQDYDLSKWIEKGKLLWVDPENEDKLIDGPPEAFPYAGVSGRRHPYYIEEGKVHDLPDPVEGKPEIILGDIYR